MREFRYDSQIPIPARDAFEWHLRAGALRRLLPPWKTVDVISTDDVVEGGKTALRIFHGPVRSNWTEEHVEVHDEELLLKDRQVKGPFGTWEHTLHVGKDGNRASRLEDVVRYRLPFWLFGGVVGDRLVRRHLSRQFGFRHRTAANDLSLYRKYAPERSWRVAVTGSNGFVGSQLVSFLEAGGHTVYRLEGSESSDTTGHIHWDYLQGTIDLDRLEGIDAVVHLGVGSILSPRWSRQKKMEIIGSRLRGTEHLAKSLAALTDPPPVFLSASAIGYYGNRGTEILDEMSPPGDDGFLSAICQDSERASTKAAGAGIRTVQMRIGTVLSPSGGILSRLVVPFQWGLGGRYGGPKQYLSWIGLDDMLGAIYHVIADERIEGPVNLTSPNPVTMTEFAQTLGRVLSRPSYVNMPPWLVRLLLGEVADDAALMSVRALPHRLDDTGYIFLHPTLEGMLRHALGRE